MATLVKRTLEQNEAIIEMGVRSFIDVGNALMDIRDKKQYADKFDSFEGYCQKRWGFTRQRARQYIESTVAVSDLTTIVVTETDKSSGKTQIPPPVNEAQARAVAEAADDAETRQRVWKEAVELAPKDEAGKPKVTASVVKKAAEKVVGKPSKSASPRPKADQPTAREPGDDPPEPQHTLPTDRSGNPLPDRPEIIRAFKACGIFASCEVARNVIWNNSFDIAKLLPDGEAFKMKMDKAMKELHAVLESFEPAYVCKNCNGGRCVKCNKRGYSTCK